jgi:hypothetical protein
MDYKDELIKAQSWVIRLLQEKINTLPIRAIDEQGNVIEIEEQEGACVDRPEDKERVLFEKYFDEIKRKERRMNLSEMLVSFPVDSAYHSALLVAYKYYIVQMNE